MTAPMFARATDDGPWCLLCSTGRQGRRTLTITGVHDRRIIAHVCPRCDDAPPNPTQGDHPR